MKNFHYLTLAALLMFYGCGNTAEYDACGNFESDEVLVVSQGAGQLLWFDVQEGATVKEGLVLGTIDTVQLGLQRTQLTAQLKSLASSRPDIETQVASLKSQIANLESEKVRINNLVSKGAAASKQLDDINAQLSVLEKQLSAQITSLKKNSSTLDHNASSVKAQIDMVNDRIAKCSIASPVDGTVIAKYVNRGEVVNPGTPLFKVADLENMYLRAYFTSDQLGSINLGDTVKLTADFGADQQYEYEGKIVWISSESEFTPKAIQTRNTRANLVYAVKIAVKNDGRLKLGMYGEVTLQ